MSEIINETKEEVKEHLLHRDVRWVGSEDGEYSITWEEFLELPPTEYDQGYGAQKIARDLVVVFDDGSWLSRNEYDGSEGWVYNKTPQTVEIPKKFNKLKTNNVGWEYLDKITND